MTDTMQVIEAVLMLLIAVGWLHGMTTSMKRRNWALAAIEFCFPPVGVVHGWGSFILTLVKIGRVAGRAAQ